MKVCSVYDGFFVGGSRIVHTKVTEGLKNDHNFDMSVLSMSNMAIRDGSTQSLELSPQWEELKMNGIIGQSIKRKMSDNFTIENIKEAQSFLTDKDILMVLKENPLEHLIPVIKYSKILYEKPLTVSLHRSDPENQGPGLLKAVSEGYVKKLICCGYSVLEAYAKTGIPENKMVVVENGIDTQRFIFKQNVRDQIREKFNIPQNAPVIIQAARFDKMKGIPLFLKTVKEFLKKEPESFFIMCGAGMSRDNPEWTKIVKEIVGEKYINKNIFGLGIIPDMTEIYSAADLLALSSSFGEAAPLVILESLSTGLIPVVTDIGDCARMVPDKTLVAELNENDMSEKRHNALKNKKTLMSKTTREKLDSKTMINKYSNILKTL